MVSPTDSTEVDAIARAQPFHYRDRGLGSRNTSSDSLDEKQESGYSTPIHYDEHDQSRSDISLTGHNGGSGHKKGGDNNVGYRGVVWPWSRGDNGSGTIC